MSSITQENSSAPFSPRKFSHLILRKFSHLILRKFSHLILRKFSHLILRKFSHLILRYVSTNDTTKVSTNDTTKVSTNDTTKVSTNDTTIAQVSPTNDTNTEEDRTSTRILRPAPRHALALPRRIQAHPRLVLSPASRSRPGSPPRTRPRYHPSIGDGSTEFPAAETAEPRLDLSVNQSFDLAVSQSFSAQGSSRLPSPESSDSETEHHGDRGGHDTHTQNPTSTLSRRWAKPLTNAGRSVLLERTTSQC
jgi:hypothetical protein